MLVYTDVLSNDELLSDSFIVKEVDDVVYRVECRLVKKGNVEIDIGANPATGEGEEPAEEAVEDGSYEVIDVVDALRLESTAYDKKSYMAHIKEYMKAIKNYLQENKPDRVAAFEKGAVAYVKKVLENFSKYGFFTGESCDPEAMTVLYEEADDGKTYMIYWKDGLKAQKY